MKLVFLGLSITSSWGNGHATNYRALLQALDRRGHDVVFLERDVPWYAAQRDLAQPPYGRTALYADLDELERRWRHVVAGADAVVVGSYVPDGIEVGRWVRATAGGVRAFYDIDTPVTLAAVEAGTCAYLDPALIAAYDLYLSFTGGPTLEVLEQRWHSPRARPFYCLVDAEAYAPRPVPLRWDLGYLGTYSEDRQAGLDRLLLEPCRRRPELRGVVAGPQYPAAIDWPPNVERIDHLPPTQHADFYAAQRLTVSVTRADMLRAGWSPSVRLFEAAACGVPVVSDRWPGMEDFFEAGAEILVADDAGDVLAHLDATDAAARLRIGGAARARVLAAHTAEHRAAELERHLSVVAAGRQS